MDYFLYLKSPEWQEKRRRVWRRARGRCERCGTEGRDVHHLTYERLGNEDLNDLLLVCRLCHGYAHDKSIDQMLNQAIAEFFTKFPSGHC